MNINRSRYNKYIFSFFLIILTALIFERCTTTKPIIRYGYETQQIKEADSLFRIGNYEGAKNKYIEIRDKSRNQTAAACAQYSLGFINIYYDNPFANYNTALEEFKLFVKKFPNNQRLDLANNWIRILTILKNSKKKKVDDNVEKLKEIEMKQEKIINEYETLQESYKNCNILADSLAERIKVLEGVIEALDKIK